LVRNEIKAAEYADNKITAVRYAVRNTSRHETDFGVKSCPVEQNKTSCHVCCYP
jgi:hypothetical protein